MGLRVIEVWDDRDYDPTWRRFVRRASRAVVIKGGMVAMVKSTVQGFYKFPGGGVKKGESRISALVREAREEAGLAIIRPSIRELGMLWEIRKSRFEREIFDHRSYFYLAKANSRVMPQQLEKYEKALGFVLEFVDPEKALENNLRLFGDKPESFIMHESRILKEIIEKKKN